MPELPEVENVCRAIRPNIIDKTVQEVLVNRIDLRVPIERGLLREIINLSVASVERRAKYIIVSLGGKELKIHLGMSGNLRFTQDYIERKHDHVIVKFSQGGFLIFNDPRRFGLFSLDYKLEYNPYTEPLASSFSSEYLAQALKNRRLPIKSALMNSKIVAGIGNIYASEILFRAGISPLYVSTDLDSAQLDKIVAHSKEVLQEAINLKGSTIKTYKGADGKVGGFQNFLQVYGKHTCFKCASILKCVKIAGRSSYFCQECQKP